MTARPPTRRELLALLGAGLACGSNRGRSETQPKPDTSAREAQADGATSMTMTDDPLYYPFSLDARTVERAEILYGFYSAKSGAGRQEITITGTGDVTLFYSRSRGDTQPAVLRGSVSRALVVRLLELMEGRQFLKLEDEYPVSGRPLGRRTIRLNLPNLQKSVHLDEPGLYSFEQMAGAIMLTAAVARGEVVQNRFFPNL